MLVVRVELHSAVTGKVSEIARMSIVNDGLGSSAVGHYDGKTFVGRDKAALDRCGVRKAGRVESWPRQRLHVWNLVAAMLGAMGYGR